MRTVLLQSLAVALIGCGTIAKAENLIFFNRCAYPVEVGKTWTEPFAVVDAGQSYVHNLGADDVPREAIAIYAFRPGRNGGAGNATLAEFTLNHQGVDYYDVSIVDAFSVPMSIHPPGFPACPVAACEQDLIDMCPASQRLIRDGVTIACTKFNDRDNPNNPLARLAAEQCPNAYSWSSSPGTKGCNGSRDFMVTLCKK
ncbi:MAG: thaumatin family protein [Pseudomonadota bacterium]